MVSISTRSGPGPESKNFQGSSKEAGIVSERSDLSSARARSWFEVTASYVARGYGVLNNSIILRCFDDLQGRNLRWIRKVGVRFSVL